ncbi:MAG TPA: DUF6356 family protein [Steroidobacteraceae bacterium]
MNIWRRLFTEHPASVNETYFQHFASAMGFGLRMVWGGIVCMIHAIVPAVYCSKASGIIGELHDRMITNRRRLERAPELAPETRRAA